MTGKVHIHRPKAKYIPQVRQYGKKRWESLVECETPTQALIAVAETIMAEDYKRGRVLMCAEWYDPHVVCEVKK